MTTMGFKKITEEPSNYGPLEKMTTGQLLSGMNQEDKKITGAIAKAMPQIEELTDKIYARYQKGGRLFYIGAGTSGRLGILDAAEIPPTYGIRDRIIGVMAGGDKAIRKAVEFAEDNKDLAQKDLEAYGFGKKDALIGIAASGTTPYVIGGLRFARSLGALTGCMTNNPGAPVVAHADVAIEIVVGPEFVTGSTRMKSGTAQKMTLNMISTALMIKTGRVKGNKMVNMQLNNDKLINRGINFITEELKVNAEEAGRLLRQYGSVSEVLRARG